MPLAHPFDPATLRRFLLGTLPPDLAARVAEWVERAPDAPDRLQAVDARDTVVEAIGAADTAHTDPGRTAVRAPAAPAPGGPAFVGGYRIVRTLGEGGMGVVFEGEDPTLGRRVAIKQMLGGAGATAEARARFLAEARAVARVSHPNVVPVLHAGDDGGAPFLVMPLLRGEPLDARLKRAGALPPAELARLARDVAAGLAAAHAAGLVHRDVKPANVWLDADTGRAVLLDFGLAKCRTGAADLTRAGAVLGTAFYMAPEQADGKPVDARADLFALGAVLFHAGTGHRPFAGDSVLSVLYAVKFEAPDAARLGHLPAPLAALMADLLEKNPADRPQTADAVLARLDAIDAPATPRVRRSRRPLLLAGAALALAAAGAALALRKPEPKTQTDRPQPEAVASDPGAQEPDDRAMAEYALSVDAETGFRRNGRFDLATDAKKLPQPGRPFQVTGLKFTPSRIPADGWARFAGCQHLLALDASGCRLKDADLAHFAQSKGLQRLILTGTDVTDAGLAPFRACRDLERLSLDNTAVTDAGLAHFKDCAKLTGIALSQTNITDDGLEALAARTGLDHLSLSMCPKVSDAGLAHFKNCQKLELLNLGRTPIGDAGLAHLAANRGLVSLAVHETRVTDAGLAALNLAKLVKLRNLAADHCAGVTDAGLADLKEHPTLETLVLHSNAGVTDATLAVLATCPTLRYLDVRYTKVTAAGVATFRRARPNCQVDGDEPAAKN